ncbi:pentatricopeptide repeat-containing protein [Quercus suber]|uniref:Pentatricopeptide repeat-containing protein n=1 Tax=Quercus suber TaxID=58331 RepID=A0AAW0K3K5_QUESU
MTPSLRRSKPPLIHRSAAPPEGKTKKAAYLVKKLDKENLVSNASTFSALIRGQCVRKNSEHAFQLYKSMVRSGCCLNEQTFKMLISTFCRNEDFDGAVQVLWEMIERSLTPDSGILSERGKSQLAKMLCSEMEARHLIPAGFEKSKTINFGAENENKASGDNCCEI